MNVTQTTTMMTTTGSAVDVECQTSSFKFVLYVLVMGVTCVLGLSGNTLSFLVLHGERSTPVASLLLKALALSDNLFLLLWMVHYSVREMRTQLGLVEDGVAWLYVRVYTFPVLYMAQTLTIWLTVLIALNRFMAVCVPYRAPHMCSLANVHKEVATVALFAFLYNVPRFFELEVLHAPAPAAGLNDSTTTTSLVSWNRTAFGSSHVYQTLYVDHLYVVFTFVLPLLILVVVNTSVICAYQKSQRRRRTMSSRRSHDNENNITLVMIMVVVIFVTCQAPARLVQLVLGYTFSHCRHASYYLIHVSNTLEVLNSSVNFLLYCIFHRRFRDILLDKYLCCARSSDCSSTQPTTEGLLLEEGRVSSAHPGAGAGSGRRGAGGVNGVVVRAQVPATKSVGTSMMERASVVHHDDDEHERRPGTGDDDEKVREVTTTDDNELTTTEHEDLLTDDKELVLNSC